MARNKREGHLDQPTRNHLSALDRALLDLSIDSMEQQPDEFTVEDLLKAANNNTSLTTIRRKARKLVEAGKWSCRCLKGIKYFKVI
jgi:hypothetical protein